MFQKIRLRLTFLCGAITTLITVAMTIGYLYISEKTLIENRLMSCRNDIFTITSNLEQQTVISHAWLAKLETGNNYYISLLDNGMPFWFNNGVHSEDQRQLLNSAWDFYRQNGSCMTEYRISYRSSYKSFQTADYCFVITLETKGAVLEMLLILPSSEISGQILRQRLGFLATISLALFAIWLFAWFFTGKLLSPIEKNREKQNRFIAAASHELRTPLAVILSCAESGTNHSDDAPETSFSRPMSVIRNEALQMRRLLEDLLTLSSRDLGTLSIHKSSVWLDTLLLNAYESFEPMAKTKHILMSVTLPDDTLPPCICDKERIYQVLSILLHNALSYSSEGGKINLSLKCSAKYFILSVSDNGPGIPDDEKPRIFDRFYRSEKSRSSKDHFGLGLSIAYEIISAHQGSITVCDTAGGGATFVVRLPYSP
ncbi:MAG: HAMP domain-containing histidine kinase [Bacteroidales bacterium]|nr:HAMP domain-containing histidine kinase [Lachnoclostridium sp.]MCM1383515.1 HAMP domain-containing histidine kinase [Lachnoclostridium sp.]MCM1464202.1 HAMP domain-containing histidine kinase [Bacteroidales bacterium]